MKLLHFHSSYFGDNPAPYGLLTALRRSDSGKGGVPSDTWLDRALLSQRTGRVIRATADLLARRMFGFDVDACQALCRYAIASAIPRGALSTGRQNPFVFASPPEPPGSSTWQAETNSAPSHPRSGRGRPFHTITGALQ